MSRLTINLVAQTADPITNLVSIVPGAEAQVFARNADGSAGSAAIVFANATSSDPTALTQPLTVDDHGRIPGWLDPGDYVVRVTSGLLTYSVPYSVSGAGGGGGGGGGTITTAQFTLPGIWPSPDWPAADWDDIGCEVSALGTTYLKLPLGGFYYIDGSSTAGPLTTLAGSGYEQFMQMSFGSFFQIDGTLRFGGDIDTQFWSAGGGLGTRTGVKEFIPGSETLPSVSDLAGWGAVVTSPAMLVMRCALDTGIVSGGGDVDHSATVAFQIYRVS